MVLTTLPKHSLLTLLTYFWPFSLTHFFWPSCKHICWHSIWLILWHLATTSLTTLSGVQHATLNTQYRGWGPARHTELALSRLGSSTPHSTRNIAVGVQHATLNSQYRGWGPARHTELIRSRLGSSTPHWTERMPVAIGVQHATLNWEDPSCHCGPARHTEHRGSQLIEENDEGEEGEEEEEGGEETDIKSNNPHLTGGEKSNARAYQCLWQRTATPWYHDTIIPQCCHKFPQSPLPVHPASAMTKERVTTNSTATNRWKQTVVHNTDKRWPCAVYFVYVCNDCKVLNVTWQRLT